MVSSLGNCCLSLCLSPHTTVRLRHSHCDRPGLPQTISTLPGSRGCLPALDCRELCFTHSYRQDGKVRQLLHACLVSTSQRTLQFLFPVGGRQLPRQPVDLGQAALVATVYLSDIGNAFTLFPSRRSNSPGTAATAASLELNRGRLYGHFDPGGLRLVSGLVPSPCGATPQSDQ